MTRSRRASCRKEEFIAPCEAYSVTLLLASKAICLLIPSSYIQPRFPNAVLWRSRTRHAGVCSVYSITNAFSRFHVDSEIASWHARKASISARRFCVVRYALFPYDQTWGNDVIVPENNFADLANVVAFIKSS